MKNVNKFIGAIALGAGLLTIPSCSDTWDDHYGIGGDDTSASTTETLWDIISSNPKLSRFKEIAEKSTYYRDEIHPQIGYTFKDRLQSSTLETVWVPEDDAISDAMYNKLLEMTETRGYTVQQQFMANSMAMWRQLVTGGGVYDTDTLTMLNGKKMAFNKSVPSMQGINIDKNQMNISASNGVLHILEAPLPFTYNIYEYLKDSVNAEDNNLKKYHEIVVENDTTYFSEDNSVEGAPDINGNPTYVDSVYFTSNTMFYSTHNYPSSVKTEQYLTYDESIGANINSEDSTFIMLMPTDAAWQAAHDMLEPYYKYSPVYADNEKLQDNDDAAPRRLDVDSLKEKCIDMDIASPLCFNLNMQPNSAGRIGQWKLDDFMANSSQAKYFLNTYGDTLRTDDNWDKTTLLQGSTVDLTNGIGIKKTSWDIPAKLYKPDVYVELGNRSVYAFTKSEGTWDYYRINYENTKSWMSEEERPFNDDFYCLSPPVNQYNQPKFSFKLKGTDGENRESEVMSGKYDIIAVMVPNYYITSRSEKEITPRVGELSSDATHVKVGNDTIPVKHQLMATIYYCDGSDNGKQAQFTTPTPIAYDGQKIQEVVLFQDFEFPYSYKNMIHSYPVLEITSKQLMSADRMQGNTTYLCIDRIILRSKDN